MFDVQVYNNCGTNAYVVSNNEATIIIDPGGSENALYMEKQMINTEIYKNIKLIILTHGHYDHINGTSFLKNKLNVPILMHQDDVRLLDKKIYNLQTRTLIGALGKKIIKEPHCLDVFRPDIVMDNKDISLIRWGINATILHTPGHTKGSISLLAERQLFAGDTFMNIFKPTEALFAEDFYELDATINKLKKYNIVNVYPGHGNYFQFNNILANRKKNKFFM